MRDNFYNLLKSAPRSKMTNVVDNSLAKAKREIFQHGVDKKRAERKQKLIDNAHKHFDTLKSKRLADIEKNFK